MAEVSFVRSDLEGDMFAYLWETLTNGDDGTPVEHPGKADRVVQVTGTFGAGGTVVIEGSNKAAPSADADWFTLVDQSDNALSFTAAGGEVVLPLTRWIRPHVTAGDGTTDLDVTITMGGR